MIRRSIGTKGRARERANQKETRDAGLVSHTVEGLEEIRKVDTRANRNRRARKEAKERTKENNKRVKDMVVETVTTPAEWPLGE